jgi:hypothetical protein
MTDSRSVDLPRLALFDFKWVFGWIVIGTLAQATIQELLPRSSGALYGGYFLVAVPPLMAWRAQRKASGAVESKLRELGFSSAVKPIKANPPPAFLWNRSFLTMRRALTALAVILCTFPLIPVGALLLRDGRWPRTPPALSWEFLGEFEFFGVSIAAAIVCCCLIRRHDASIARWEKAQAQASRMAGGRSLALRRWPIVLFGTDWESRSGALRDAWLASNWSSPDGDANYRALEQIVRWLRQVERSENARERQFYSRPLRRLAWRYALALDPTLANVG